MRDILFAVADTSFRTAEQQRLPREASGALSDLQNGQGTMPVHTEARENRSIAWQAADWASKLSRQDIPPEVVDNAKLRILDVIGVLLAADSD